MENEFVILWLDGKKEYVKGRTTAESFRNAGYTKQDLGRIFMVINKSIEDTYRFKNNIWRARSSKPN